MLQCYSDFLSELRSSGFSMGGGNAKGIYSLLAEAGEGKEPANSPIRWHSELPDVDPWEWRMRVLEEESDIAYGKFFFKSSGYITDLWYPHFFSVRRGESNFDDIYNTGTISHMSKRIYDVISAEGQLPLHQLKLLCGVRREESVKFDRAMTELQMKMFITMCGRSRKLNKYGLAYGWNSTVFCTVEDFWSNRGIDIQIMDPEKSYHMLRKQVLKLNPDADEKQSKSLSLEFSRA